MFSFLVHSITTTGNIREDTGEWGASRPGWTASARGQDTSSEWDQRGRGILRNVSTSNKGGERREVTVLSIGYLQCAKPA